MTSAWIKKVFQYRNTLYVILTPLLLLPIPIVIPGNEAICGYVILWMAIYWITQAIPLGVTSFLPLIVFPFTGVVSGDEISKAYFKDTAWLYFGGIIIAISVEITGLHRRIALRVLSLLSAKPRSLMVGFMGTTYFLSMWISNTATTAMMMPIVEAVFQELKEEGNRKFNIKLLKKVEGGGKEKSNDIEFGEEYDEYDNETKAEFNQRMERLIKAMTLCVPYASSVGGTATLTGTGGNLVLAGQFSKFFPMAIQKISFGYWMAYSFPTSLVMLILTFFWISLFYFGFKSTFSCCWGVKKSKSEKNAENIIKKEYKKLGSIKWAEVTVLIVFTSTALLWFFRDPGFLTGWSELFRDDYITDGTVAMTMAALLFVLPSEKPNFLRKSKDIQTKGSVAPILNWSVIQRKFPWDILFLLTGGFALAAGATKSGFSQWMGIQLALLGGNNDWVICLVVTIIVCIFTECTSNTATVSLFLPILAQLAITLKIHPLYLMIPPVLSSALAFMLPVATPPNAIAFSYGHIKVLDLVKVGWVLNILGVFLISVFINTLGVPYFGLGTFPDWAAIENTTLFNN